MNDPLRQAETRLERYWKVDGVHEIGVALILALTALWVWTPDRADLRRSWKGAFSTAFPLLLMGGIAVEQAFVKSIRKRLTYPRVWFAELRRPARTAQVKPALIAIAFDLRRWSLALIGLGLSALLWRIGSRANLTRFRAVAAMAAAFGIAISGGITLWRFLRA
jgi:hypothetical protein